MELSEVKKAMYEESEVEYGGARYKPVCQCIMRFDKLEKSFKYSLQLRSTVAKQSYVIAPIEQVNIVKEDDVQCPTTNQ